MLLQAVNVRPVEAAVIDKTATLHYNKNLK